MYSRRSLWAVILSVVCLFFLHPTLARASIEAEPSSASESRSTAIDVVALASNDTWRQLGRYKRSFGVTGYRSDIVTAEHFLSPDGSTDAAAELSATLNALRAPIVPGQADNHALCQYPARAIWLDQQAQLNLPDPLEVCPAYRAWAMDGQIEGVSVLYVAGYFSNPGSAFGHLLLRLHTNENPAIEDVLDQAINYGAAESEQDGMLPYIVKGLLGGYRSRFTNLEVFHQNQRYREAQLRNVWEYRLDLTDEEIALLVAHLWELRGAENRYYFLRQNCAYRVAETLELVIDAELVPENKIWMAPIDTFHRLADADGALSNVKRLASRETLFREGYEALSATDRSTVDHIIAASQGGEMPNFQGATAPALNVLIDYYAYTIDSGSDSAVLLREQERQALARRFTQPVDASEARPAPTPPHQGQWSSMIRVGAVTNSERGEGGVLRIRPALNDLLSISGGTNPYSELSMMEAELVYFDEEIELRQLEAVRVFAMNPKRQGSPAPPNGAWRVAVGASARDLGCEDCLLGYGEFAYGRALEVRPGTALYGLGLGRVMVGGGAENVLDAGIAVGGVLSYKDQAAAFELGVRSGIDEVEITTPYGRLDWRLAARDRWDIRAGIGYDEATEAQLSVAGFW